MSFNKYSKNSKKHWIRMNKIAWQNKKINDNLKGTFYLKNIQQKKICQKIEPTGKKISKKIIMTKKNLPRFSKEEKRILRIEFNFFNMTATHKNTFRKKINGFAVKFFKTELLLNQWRQRHKKI